MAVKRACYLFQYSNHGHLKTGSHFLKQLFRYLQYSSQIKGFWTRSIFLITASPFIDRLNNFSTSWNSVEAASNATRVYGTLSRTEDQWLETWLGMLVFTSPRALQRKQWHIYISRLFRTIFVLKVPVDSGKFKIPCNTVLVTLKL